VVVLAFAVVGCLGAPQPAPSIHEDVGLKVSGIFEHRRTKEPINKGSVTLCHFSGNGMVAGEAIASATTGEDGYFSFSVDEDVTYQVILQEEGVPNSAVLVVHPTTPEKRARRTAAGRRDAGLPSAPSGLLNYEYEIHTLYDADLVCQPASFVQTPISNPDILCDVSYNYGDCCADENDCPPAPENLQLWTSVTNSLSCYDQGYDVAIISEPKPFPRIYKHSVYSDEGFYSVKGLNLMATYLYARCAPTGPPACWTSWMWILGRTSRMIMLNSGTPTN